jgi:hypothetical protein
VAAAGLLDLGVLHRLEHGDSIVPVLVSLQRWTPFYWDQERYGMLAPLLALPVRDPLWNLLLQRGLLVLAGLSAVVLLARHVLGDRDWPLAGTLAAALLLPLAPAAWAFEYLGDQPYGLSLALALLGLALAEPPPMEVRLAAGAPTRPPRRRLLVGAGLLLVLAAHWVNAATGVLLLALALARAVGEWFEGDRAAALDRLRVDAALLGAGLAAGQAALLAWPALTGHPLRLPLGLLPPGEWPSAWRALAGGALREQGGWLLALAVLAVAGVALLSLPRAHQARRGALLRAGVLLAAALGYAAFAGSLRWVAENHFHWRYLAPSALLVHLAAVSLLAEPLARAARLARPALAAALLALPLCALAVAGPPSLAGVRRDLDAVAGRWTEDVLAARCDLVAGDYWTVWPAVWHAALVSRERGLDRPIYGVAHRANPTAPAWLGRPAGDLRICRPHGEAAALESERWLRTYGRWPVRLLERRATLDVLVVEVAGPGGPPG